MKSKTCPKCAETVLAAAERCKYCGANVKGLEPELVNAALNPVDAALGTFLCLVAGLLLSAMVWCGS